MERKRREVHNLTADRGYEMKLKLEGRKIHKYFGDAYHLGEVHEMEVVGIWHSSGEITDFDGKAMSGMFVPLSNGVDEEGEEYAVFARPVKGEQGRFNLCAMFIDSPYKKPKKLKNGFTDGMKMECYGEIFTLKRWKKHDNDRIYINDHDGDTVGIVDLQTGEVQLNVDAAKPAADKIIEMFKCDVEKKIEQAEEKARYDSEIRQAYRHLYSAAYEDIKLIYGEDEPEKKHALMRIAYGALKKGTRETLEKMTDDKTPNFKKALANYDVKTDLGFWDFIQKYKI